MTSTAGKPPPSPALWRQLAGRLPPGFGPDGGAEALSGGLLNQVWRLRAADGRTVILKYAPPHVASDPAVPLSPARLDHEARALRLFAPGGRLATLAGDDDATIRPPRLLGHLPAAHALWMEDVGPANDLGLALAVAGRRPVASWGQALGAFVGRLHRASLRPGFPAAALANPAIQEARLHIQYRAVGEQARLAGVRAWRRVGRRAVALGEAFLQPGRCLVMGDLWLASVLVTPAARLRMIDWEFAHFGQPAQDLGHFGAHCWLHAHWAATAELAGRYRRLWRAFWRGYQRALGPALAGRLLDATTRAQINLHAGAEIVVRTAGRFAPPERAAADMAAKRAAALAVARGLLLEETPGPPGAWW